MGERALQSRRAPRPSEPAYGVEVAGPRHGQLTQLATALNAAPRLPVQSAGMARDGSGSARLPERLKDGVEALSGIAMDEVRIHYDSPRPAQLQAHAFAEGGDIHLAPGQSHHLPHEAWHIAQQAQGRVKPTAQLKGGVAINDDAGLEREADAMGARALAMPADATAGAVEASAAPLAPLQAKAVVQRTAWELTDAGWEAIGVRTNAPPPDIGAQRVGAVYDDDTGRLYWSRNDYDMAGPEDLSDDDNDMDYEDEDVGESDLDDDDEDDQPYAMEDVSDLSDETEMDLDTRRKIDDEALRRPLTSSLLDAPNPLFKSRTMSSRDKFKVGKVMGQRTQQAGAVSITLQSVGLWVKDKVEVRERPIKVVGIVDPTATTGRGSAPDPLSGYQVYSGQGQRPKASIAGERNTGALDVERGHLMALELGGPDIAENIVPQWAKFQGSGEWRKMEVSVLAKAKALKKGQQLRYSIEVFYKGSGAITPTLRTFGFPTGFKTTTQVIDGKNAGAVEVEFHQGQAQDQTDQMLAERAMAKLDGPDWDPSLNRQKAGGKKKRASVKAVKLPDRAVVRKKAADQQIANTKSKREEVLKKRRNLPNG
ncbi:MAG: hypothetical protein QOJ27_107 [Sphingomonadales bacterium]|nr:hypothetical protein [Sphingomonadales bacterium]